MAPPAKRQRGNTSGDLKASGTH